jgi:putative transposase
VNNKNEKHLSAADLAGLPGLPSTTRGVRFRAAEQQWPWRQRRGRGGGVEYPVSCLPGEAQAALASSILSTAPEKSFSVALPVSTSASEAPEIATTTVQRRDLRAESLAITFDAKSQKLKDEARARLAIVQTYHELLDMGIARMQAAAATQRKHDVAASTLWKYLRLIEGEPSHLWLYKLLPGFTGRTAHAEMSAEAWEMFKGDYLRIERPTAKKSYNLVKRAAASSGWEWPSYKTVMRRLEREIPPAMQVYAREGRKAAQGLYPAQARVYAALHALAVVNGDGYKHNVWVKFDDGDVVRPNTWVWQDAYSKKILAYRVDKTENTDQIRLAFAELLERFPIPDAVLLDNTRAAANKQMSGGVRHRFRFTVREEEPWGVFKLLDIDVRWATPGHGQAKPIERIFGTGGLGEYVDKAPEFKGAWTGANPLDKPEYDGKGRTIPIAEFEEVLAREIAALNAMKGRRSPLHAGRSFDDVFAESFAQIIPRVATDEQRRLWLLATEAVTVRGGEIILDSGRMVGERAANRYWNEALLDFNGKRVAARFDPKRLHQGAHIYTLDGRYICFADCVDPAAFDDRAAAREHLKERKRFLRATKDALQAEVRMDSLAAAKRLPDRTGAPAPAAEIPAPKVVRAAFRDPLERPRVEPKPLSAADQVFMEQAEAAVSPSEISVHQLRSTTEKHEFWKGLNKRRAAGETLSDQNESFWKSWQSSDFYRIQADLDQEDQQRIANGG